jgi:hypothetical protein
MPGIKHLVECHCFLKVFSQNEKQINHKFPVYSKIDQNDKVIPKLVKCNNCEATHFVYDICRSELKPGKENITTTMEKEDYVMMLPFKIGNFLLESGADISDFEHALDIVEEERWGEFIVLKRSIVDEEEQVKLVEIHGEDKIIIMNKNIKSVVRESV